jgi:hypothetical protein
MSRHPFAEIREENVKGQLERKKEDFQEIEKESGTERILPEKKEKKKVILSQLSIRIPEELDRQLERFCFDNDLKKQEVMADAIKEYIARRIAEEETQ